MFALTLQLQFKIESNDKLLLKNAPKEHKMFSKDRKNEGCMKMASYPSFDGQLRYILCSKYN